MYKLIKVVIVLLVHVFWCVLIFVYQMLIINTNYNIPRSYKLNILFTDIEGISNGTPISYRGINIGKVTSINLYNDYVVVSACIKSSKILIPFNAYVKTYKTIFTADTILHIHNKNFQRFNLSNSAITSFCCNNDFIYGFQGASLDNLVDVLIRVLIYLDSTDTIDLLYNLMHNCNHVIKIVKHQLLKNI